MCKTLSKILIGSMDKLILYPCPYEKFSSKRPIIFRGQLTMDEVLSIIYDQGYIDSVCKKTYGCKEVIDISDEVADAYMHKYDIEYFPENYEHPFVMRSSAYDFSRQIYEHEEYLDRTYGTYEKQHSTYHTGAL